MKLRVVTAVIFAGWMSVTPVFGDTAFGIDASYADRQLLDQESSEGSAFRVFYGVDFDTDFMWYMRYGKEETVIPMKGTGVMETQIDFVREEFGLDCHWFHEDDKGNDWATFLGIFRTDYSDLGYDENSFIGYSLGARGTRFVGNNVYLQAAGQMRLPASRNSRSSESKLGYEAEVVLGVIIGADRWVGARVGYRMRRQSFGIAYPDDRSSEVFAGIVVFLEN